MTPEQIEKWAREADTHATVGYAPFHTKEWGTIRDTEFARLVRNASLEEAKAACEAESHRLAGHPDYARSGAVQRMANLIDALKEPQP